MQCCIVADVSGVVADAVQRQHLLRGRQSGHVLSVPVMPYIRLLRTDLETGLLPPAAGGTAGQR